MIRETLSAEMTLPAFYHAYVHPVCRVAKLADPKTIALDLAALKHWETLTANPSLQDITEFDTAGFIAAIVGCDGRHGNKISPNTIRKHCVHLQFILDRAGPRSRTLRNAARLIEEPPGFEKPKERKAARPALLSLDEIGAWIRAAEEAESPQMDRVVPAKWWRVLVTFTYNTGLRIDTVMRLEWTMLDQAGWLTVPPEIYKGHEHGGSFYVNQPAREALATIREWRHKRLFPWANWPASSSWLQAQRRSLWRKAGINQPGNGFHGLRRSLMTFLAGKNDLVARIVAGHAAGNDVLMGHYVDRKGIVADLLEQVPQPSFRHSDTADQRTMFEV